MEFSYWQSPLLVVLSVIPLFLYQVAVNLIDHCHQYRPPLVKDAHFNEETMEDLPYTEASMGSKRENFMGSTYNLVYVFLLVINAWLTFWKTI